MAATNMFSLDGATHYNPRGDFAYRASVVINGGASARFVHNFGRAQAKSFTTNELLVNINCDQAAEAARQHIVSFAHIVGAGLTNNAINVFNNTGTALTLRVKVWALHSAVE